MPSSTTTHPLSAGLSCCCRRHVLAIALLILFLCAASGALLHSHSKATSAALARTRVIESRARLTEVDVSTTPAMLDPIAHRLRAWGLDFGTGRQLLLDVEGMTGADGVMLDLNTYSVGAGAPLIRLAAGGSDLTDAGLVAISDQCELTELTLADTFITDASMPVIGGFMRLEALDLSRTRITDAAIDILINSLPALEYLELIDTKVTDAGIQRFRSRRPSVVVNTGEP